MPSCRHHLPITLLLLALMTRSLVAGGYMPAEDGSIRLCTPDGLISVVVDPETGEVVETGESASAECPWASTFLAAVIVSVESMRPRPPASQRLPECPETGRSERAPPGLPPVRAPPASSCSS